MFKIKELKFDFKEKRTLLLLGAFLIVVLLGFVFIYSISANNNQVSATPTPSMSVEEVAKKQAEEQAALEADKKRLEVLKNNFNYEYDEFENKGWYTHKNQTTDNSWNRIFLKVPVSSLGYGYLESDYYGDNWIFHTRVEVKIGDATYVYRTEDIPSFDPNNHRANSSSVWETVSYTAGRDNGIVKAIAESGDAIIRVRFAGGERIKDITLSKRDQQAIKDSYELLQLIERTRYK